MGVSQEKTRGTISIGSFEQRGGEENEIVMKGDKTKVIYEEAARGMEEDVAMTGIVVDLDIVFLGRVGYYPVGSTLWEKQNMTAVCKNVRVTNHLSNKI